MRIRVVARLSVLSAFIVGLPAEAIAQGGRRASILVEHRVSVVVPVIISLRPLDPASPDQTWQVRTNDPILRRRLLLAGAPGVRMVGGTLQVTITPP